MVWRLGRNLKAFLSSYLPRLLIPPLRDASYIPSHSNILDSGLYGVGDENPYF